MYDLEERTFQFAKRVYAFSREIPYSIQSQQILKQLIRSASSIGANYIEANESFSRKDFIYRIKICKKEAKETIYWLRLLDQKESDEFEGVLKEAKELRSIFGKIYQSSNRKPKS